MTTTALAASMQRALDACVADGAPGASLAVDVPSLTFSFAGASGLFERSTTRALRPDDPFRAASVTKAVTAATAVGLAADGLWQLDDPVAPFLPARVVSCLRRLAGLRRLEDLTVRRLLGHRSGVPDYFFDERFQSRVRASPDRTWRPVELIEAASDAGKLDFEPGTGFAYGDTGYVLVGIAIEHLLGRSLADAYRARIFSTLGMEGTWLEWHEPRRGPDVSHHYDGDRDVLLQNTSFDWAGGGLVTTAGDLVRFLRGLFEGRLFAQRWLGEMLPEREDDGVRWHPGSSARYLRYGLGVGANLASGEEIIGATGVWGAFAYYWPRGRAAIAGTINLRGADRSALLDAVVSPLSYALAKERDAR